MARGSSVSSEEAARRNDPPSGPTTLTTSTPGAVERATQDSRATGVDTPSSSRQSTSDR